MEILIYMYMRPNSPHSVLEGVDIHLRLAGGEVTGWGGRIGRRLVVIVSWEGKRVLG